MAQDLSASFPQIWAKEQQETFYNENVAMKITKFSTGLEGKKFGDTLTRVKRGGLSDYADIHTRGGEVDITDLTNVGENLTVNKEYSQGFYIDEFDSVQSMYNEGLGYGQDTGAVLSNQVDAEVLYEAVNADSIVDDGTIGGTSGNGITIATSNVVKILGAVKRSLKKNNVFSGNLYGVISPEMEDIFTQYVEGRETGLGDTIGKNGYIGSYMGIKFYVSNQLLGSAILSLATQPTAADTVTIAGQEFTFVSTIGTAAGNVLIGANVDATRANLATLINAPSTTTAAGVALEGDDLKKFAARVTAANDDTADTITVYGKGLGILEVASDLADGTDTWTATSQEQQALFGVVGNPYLVVQRMPKVVKKEVSNKFGANYLNGLLFGVKTFSDNAKKMVAVLIRTDAFSA